MWRKQMNKQEFKKQAEALYTDVRSFLDNTFELIDQIHEPQKVVIPKFVAEWIKSHKESFSDASAIDIYDNLTLDNNHGYYHDVWLWVIDHHYDFIRAWHEGYEIERDKLYTVELSNGQPLVEVNNILYFSSDLAASNAHVSKDKLEAAGFGWVFDCNGVKVVEVE